MAAAPIRIVQPDAALPKAVEPLHVTLLELVEAVGEITDDDEEVVATVIHMLRNGSVELTGNFHGVPVEVFCQNAEPVRAARGRAKKATA